MQDSSSPSVLIITSSGGGGLLETANAKMQEVLKENPQARVIKKDLLKEWKSLGKFCINFWNGSQKKGDVKLLEWIIYMQKFADIIFWPKIFFWAFSCLMKDNVDRVIDTQPMGTSPIVKAVRLFNHLRNKKVILEKILVDLPTDKATHYFRTIKKLSLEDQKFLRIVTLPPLLKEGETAEEFWQKHCGVSDSEIHYQKFFIRQGFNPYVGKVREHADFPIEVGYKSEEELQMMQKTFRLGGGFGTLGKEKVKFVIRKEDKLITVLLGSHPAEEATISYVKKMIEMARQIGNTGKKYYLFVFCRDHSPGAHSLYKEIHDYVIQAKPYPTSLIIIPLSFQKEEVVASLFFRSDITITRSGGQTSMELMAVMKGQSLIHSEAKKEGKKTLSKEELLSGIPGWEAGNACYLEEKKGARIITPEVFGEDFHTFLPESPVHQVAN